MVQGVAIAIAVAACVLLWARKVVPTPLVQSAAGTCRKCSYSLDGLPSSAVCPECGIDDPSYREQPRKRQAVIYPHWTLSTTVIALGALVTLWPIVLHEGIHAMVRWLNGHGFGPMFSPGPVPEAAEWVGLPLVVFMIAGIGLGEVPCRTRWRVGLWVCVGVWLVLSGLTAWSWFEPNNLRNHVYLRNAGGFGAILAVAAGVVIVPPTFWELLVWLSEAGPGSVGPLAERDEWLERSKAPMD